MSVSIGVDVEPEYELRVTDPVRGRGWRARGVDGSDLYSALPLVLGEACAFRAERDNLGRGGGQLVLETIGASSIVPAAQPEL